MSGFYPSHSVVSLYKVLILMLVFHVKLVEFILSYFLCFFQAGLTTLFYSLLLYSVSYHSLAVHLRPICRVSNLNCKCKLKDLSQPTFDFVYMQKLL